jgi:hypothetical protein
MIRRFLFLLFLAIAVCAPAQRRALIIGINDYSASQGKVKSLAGCVADALSVRGLLLSRFGFQQNEIDTLFNKAASRKNIVAALRRLELAAKKDEVIFIYYAGHGISLINSMAMKADKTTQGLLTADISSPENSVVYDFELSGFYNRMIDKGAVVTVVFDCCHSGNMTMNLAAVQYLSVIRGGETSRGVDGLAVFGDYDTYFAQRLDTQDSAASALADTGRQVQGAASAPADSGTRALPYTNVDLRLQVNERRPHEIPNSRFLFIGASQGQEKALEKRDAFGEAHGVFTKALIAAYNQGPAGMTVAQLMQYIEQKFKVQYISQRQRPNVLADRSRLASHLLGAPGLRPSDRVTVKPEKISGKSVVLAAGSGYGLEPGFLLSGLQNPQVKLKVAAVKSQQQSEAVLVQGDPRGLASEKELVISSRVAEVPPAITVYLPAQQWTQAELRGIHEQVMRPGLQSPLFLKYLSNPEARVNYIFDNRRIWTQQGSQAVVPLQLQPGALAGRFLGAAGSDPFFAYLPLPAELLQGMVKRLAGNQNVQFVSAPEKANFGLYVCYDKQNNLVVVCTEELVGTRLKLNEGRPRHLAVVVKDLYEPVANAGTEATLADLLLRTASTFRWLQ